MPKPKPPARANDELARLFRAAPTEPGEDLEGARLLPLDRIVANPYQPRQMFDDGALDDLTQSIRDQGVLQPILVRPVGDHYQIVAGERRTRAADRAGLTTIPAIVREMTEAEAVLATAAENLQREDLDLEDEARQYQYLMEVLGLSGRELAERLGKGKNYVNNRLALLQYPYLFGQLRLGELTQRQALAHIAALAPLPDQAPTSDRDIVVAHRGPLREEDSSTAEEVRPMERAVLDNPRPAPTAFRWRPWQQFATWLQQTPPTSVPPDERATARAQIAEMEARLAEWRQALEE